MQIENQKNFNFEKEDENRTLCSLCNDPQISISQWGNQKYQHLFCILLLSLKNKIFLK